MKPAKGEQLTIALTKGRILSETLAAARGGGCVTVGVGGGESETHLPHNDGGCFARHFAWL